MKSQRREGPDTGPFAASRHEHFGLVMPVPAVLRGEVSGHLAAAHPPRPPLAAWPGIGQPAAGPLIAVRLGDDGEIGGEALKEGATRTLRE